MVEEWLDVINSGRRPGNDLVGRTTHAINCLNLITDCLEKTLSAYPKEPREIKVRLSKIDCTNSDVWIINSSKAGTHMEKKDGDKKYIALGNR